VCGFFCITSFIIYSIPLFLISLPFILRNILHALADYVFRYVWCYECFSFSFNLRKTSILVILAILLIFCIPLHIHILKTPIPICLNHCYVSATCSTMLHTRQYVNHVFHSILIMLPGKNFFLYCCSTSPKWPILCQVGRKTLINQSYTAAQCRNYKDLQLTSKIKICNCLLKSATV